MFLVVCPRCRSKTLSADEAVGPVSCRYCHRLFDRRRAEVIDDPEVVRRYQVWALAGPANGLLAFGLIQIVLAVAFTAAMGFGPAGVPLTQRTSELPHLLLSAWFVLVGCVIIAGGWAIRRGRARLLGVIAAWLTLVNPILFGIPIGLNALITLHRPEVRAVFAGEESDD